MRKINLVFISLLVALLALSLNSCKYFENDSQPIDDNIGSSDEESTSVGLSDFEPWLTEIMAEDVVEIKIERKGFGLAPGTLNTIYYCNDSVEIFRIVDEFKNMKMTPAVGGEEHIRGGGGSYFTFTLEGGEVYHISTGNGFYHAPDEAYKLDSIPSIGDQYLSEKTHTFSNYNHPFEIRTCDENNTLVGGSDDLSSLEFSSLTEEEIAALPEEPIYCLTSDKFTLWIYTDTAFSYTRNDEVGYYSLGRGMSFADYIN